jgi:hypothetical protein
MKAPWTEEQVTKLNDFQKNRSYHPFTCGGDRGDEAHRIHATINGEEDWGILIATKDGWVCPVCDYKQDWALDWMAL